jgi:signal transduction histidine kinase
VNDADRDRIFDPFFTTKSRGTGIGLTVSRRFAEAVGGGVTLDPRDGGGSRASLVLPAAPARPPGGRA